MTSKLFQSTHPGGVRPICDLYVMAWTQISIHAPGWGATIPSVVLTSEWPNFNPRTRVGCDKKASEQKYTVILFQSTHPGGVRHSASMTVSLSFAFQSTHPGGVRQPSPHNWPAPVQFQSTHPGGVRLDKIRDWRKQKIFQSTHPGGVRPRTITETGGAKIFQSTHPGGVRQVPELSDLHNQVNFNPRTRVGCDSIF